MSQPDPSFLDTFTRYVLPPLLGALSGAFASIIAPWANWGVEKRREQNKARREQIQGFRDALHAMRSNILSHSVSSDLNSVFLTPPRDYFMMNRKMLPLLQHLGDDFFPDIRGSERIRVRDMEDLIEKALAKVNALEKEWKLI